MCGGRFSARAGRDEQRPEKRGGGSKREARGAGPIEPNTTEASRGRHLRPDSPPPATPRARARARRGAAFCAACLTGAAAPVCVLRGSRLLPSSMPRRAFKTVATTAPDIFGAGGGTRQTRRTPGEAEAPEAGKNLDSVAVLKNSVSRTFFLSRSRDRHYPPYLRLRWAARAALFTRWSARPASPSSPS